MSFVEPLHRPIGRLLRLAQSVDPEQLVDALSMTVAEVGGEQVALYLVDYEHRTLVPTSAELPSGERLGFAAIEGTMAGRAFLSTTPLASQRPDGWHVWIPVLDRADRIGVLSMLLPTWGEELEAYCLELGYAAALLVLSITQYTDLPHQLRRREQMSLSAEMQWSLLPPLTFTVGGATVAGLLEPAYDVGGDCFDYASNLDHLDLAVFDAVGHGVASAVLASLLVGAYRNRRRAAAGLQAIARFIDEAVEQVPGDTPFATALLARLNVSTGHMSWLSCGHPQPLHIRNGAVLPEVPAVGAPPLGLGSLIPADGEVIEVALEPGDAVLLYTDGVVEARAHDGSFLGVERLADHLEREHASGRTPAEVLRRLVGATLEHATLPLRDDASMIYVRWEGSQ